MNILNQILKFILMLPVFLFIGSGIFVSLDILQPSAFSNPQKHLLLFIIALFTGSTPVLLVSSAVKSLIDFYNRGFKSGLYMALALSLIFMFTESLYSYTSLRAVFADSEVPWIKIAGIIALPFTFSLFYLTTIILDVVKKGYKSKEDMQYLKEREALIEQIKAKGLILAIKE